MTEHYYWYRTSLNGWGSVCIILTFLFKTSFMNRLRVQLWDLQSVPLLPIYTWNVLRERLSVLLSTPPGHGIGLWMIHGSSKKQAHKQKFLDHINSMDAAIKFTVEGTQANGAIPFLDTLVTPLADNSLSFQVYGKPTHTDQYLQWDSHYSLSSKYRVIGTLTHHAKVVCTNSGLLQGEINHSRRSLGKCNYPSKAIRRVQQKV